MFKIEKIFNIQNILLLLSFIFLLNACSTLNASNGIFKQYTVGVGTHNKNEIWGRAVRFDTGWSMPSGSISCCWEATGATTTAYNQPMPKEIYVEWVEMKTQLLYKANIKISPEITKLAKSLPRITIGNKSKKEYGFVLIIGLGKNGEAVIWLSNFPNSRSDRVIYVVGKAKAYSEAWVRPSDR